MVSQAAGDFLALALGSGDLYRLGLSLEAADGEAEVAKARAAVAAEIAFVPRLVHYIDVN